LLAETPYEHVAVVSSRTIRMPVAMLRAAAMLHDLKPAHVVGLGGWPSVPTVLAATFRRLPVTLLEQNVVAGRATEWLARLGHPVCGACEETGGRLRPERFFATGNPVRLLKWKSRAPGRHVLVLGGSQGAHGLNRVTLEAMTRIPPDVRATLRVTHQTGRRDAAVVAARYAALGVDAKVAPFFDDMPARYADASVCVTRAGGTTLAELAAARLPAVCVPYPDSVRDHQLENARHFARHGAAVVVEESRRDAASLAAHLTRLLRHEAARLEMADAAARLHRPDAAAAVVDRLGIADPIAVAA
ncbi:MAG: glycosyltransferase, partial [Planctomycetota bacterium]